MITIEPYTNGKVSHDLDQIFRELAQLRAENRTLRKQIDRNRRYSVIVRKAIVDAHMILMAAFSEHPTGCIAMQRDYGMTRRRWEWGVAFLRYAGVVAVSTGGNWRDGLAFVVFELEDAIRLLEKAAVELDSADGYRRLRRLLRRS